MSFSIICVYHEVSTDITYELYMKNYMIFISTGFILDYLEGIFMTIMFEYLFLQDFYVAMWLLFSFRLNSMVYTPKEHMVYLSTVYTTKSSE